MQDARPLVIGSALPDRFVHANPRFEAIFGWSVGSLIGQPGAVVWIDADDVTERRRLDAALASARDAAEAASAAAHAGQARAE